MKSRWLMLWVMLLGFPAVAAKTEKKSAGNDRVVVQDAATGLSFVTVPKGCFRMGSPEPVRPKADFHWQHLGFDRPIDADERPVHEVCLDRFSIGETEVTAAAWRRVMSTDPPRGRGQEPAAGVSWHEVQDFLKRLNAQFGDAQYRLPTEAEWEYACRAGEAKEPSRAMSQLIAGAWYSTSLRERRGVNVVGQLPANGWGLRDMLGNVWEWTADVYHPDAYSQHALFDPVTEDRAGDRSLRGASFRSEYVHVRCAARTSYAPEGGLEQFGFRLVKAQ